MSGKEEGHMGCVIEAVIFKLRVNGAGVSRVRRKGRPVGGRFGKWLSLWRKRSNSCAVILWIASSLRSPQ